MSPTSIFRKIDPWRLVQLASPFVVAIAFIVFMKAEITAAVEDVQTLKEDVEATEETVANHETQIALNTDNLSDGEEQDLRLEASILRLEAKIDTLLRNQREN